MRTFLETPAGYINTEKINESWYSYFLCDIKLGEESPEIVIRSIQRFLEGVSRTDPTNHKVFYSDGNGLHMRELFYVGAPHAMLYVIYKLNGEMELFLHKYAHPTDLKMTLCSIAHDLFYKWAKEVNCHYNKIMPNSENTILTNKE